MIVSFPSHVMPVEIHRSIPKGTPTQLFHFVGVSMLVFCPPINLKPMDCVLVDMQTGHVELIQRGSITIWHAAWKN